MASRAGNPFGLAAGSQGEAVADGFVLSLAKEISKTLNLEMPLMQRLNPFEK